MMNTNWREKLSEGLVNDTNARGPIPNVVKRERDRLKELLQTGLPSVYDDWEDMMYDWYPDFSWSTKPHLEELLMVANDPEWQQLADQIKDKYGFDWKDEIRQGIQAAQEGSE